MIKQKIAEIEKEIEEEKRIFNTLDESMRNRLIKEFAQVTEGERLYIIKIAEAKLQAYKDAQEIIGKKIKKFCDEILQPLTNLSVKVERKNYFHLVSSKEKELLKNLGISGENEKIYADFKGKRFYAPFRCLCCGEKVSIEQFCYGRTCAYCDCGRCQKGKNIGTPKFYVEYEKGHNRKDIFEEAEDVPKSAQKKGKKCSFLLPNGKCNSKYYKNRKCNKRLCPWKYGGSFAMAVVDNVNRISGGENA